MSYQPSVSPEELDELLESHQGSFEHYWANNSSIIPVKPVDSMSGTSPRLPVEQGRVAAKNPKRRSLVSTGKDTPKGHLSDDEIPFKLNEYRWAVGVNAINKKAAARYISDLDGILRDQCAHQVLFDDELELSTILRGDGISNTVNTQATTVETLANADRFDDFVNSNPVNVIQAAIRETGGDTAFMGWDVAQALAHNPQFTGSDAASGKEYLGFEELMDKLRGLGLRNIHIDHVEYHDGPREFAYAQAWAHDGVFAIARGGVIRKMVLESLQYDMFEDKDSRDEYARALMTCAHQVQFKEFVKSFKNVLTP